MQGILKFFLPAENTPSTACRWRCMFGVLMATAPTTVTLTAGTAATVSVSGVWSNLYVLPLTAGVVAYARGDGATAVAKTDGAWACPAAPAEPTRIPVSSTDGENTTVSVICASNCDVHVTTVEGC